jgi:hypothetical protein
MEIDKYKFITERGWTESCLFESLFNSPSGMSPYKIRPIDEGVPFSPYHMVFTLEEAYEIAMKQCSSTYHTAKGIRFCIKDAGHEGDHRGYRIQWNDQGTVKITEPGNGTPK